MNEADSPEIPEYGVRQEDSWILESPAQRIMREGDQPPVFSAQLARLHHLDPEKSKLLHSVCARLVFVEQLKYTLQVETAKPGPLRFQHENLINYLTLTCLDIVAGENTAFVPFPDWLVGRLSSEPKRWPKSLRTGIKQIEAAESEGEKIARLVGDIVQELHARDYLDKFGIRRNMHRLITESLPIWLREWLADTFFIVRGGITKLVFSEDRENSWLNFTMDRKLKRVADYLYESRNRFTHSTSMLPSLERPGRFSVPVAGTKYRFEDVYKNDDIDAGVDYSIGIRNGTSQSEVVRLIIVAELRSWTSIDDSEQLIEDFLRRSDYRQAAYSFLNEMNFNKMVVLEWAHARILDVQADFTRVIRLNPSSHYAAEFFELDASKPAYTGIRFDGSNRYLDTVSSINDRITNLAQEYDQLRKGSFHKSRMMIEYELDDLLSSHEVNRLLAKIQTYTQTLEQALQVPFY